MREGRGGGKIVNVYRDIVLKLTGLSKLTSETTVLFEHKIKFVQSKRNEKNKEEIVLFYRP